MSPDARLIAAAALLASPEYDGLDGAIIGVKALERELANEFPDSDRGIRGMVPVAYLKDVIEGALARMDAVAANPPIVPADGPREYLNRRLADVEGI